MKNFNYDENTPKPVCHSKRNPFKSILFGIALLAVGLIIVGNRFGYVTDALFDVLISWQSLLITLGLISLTSRKSIIPGIVLIGVGSIFLIPKAFHLGVAASHLVLPGVLITIGLIIIIYAFIKPQKSNFNPNFDQMKTEFSNDFINERYVFGGTNLHVKSQNFKGGKLEAVFGGGKVDLSDVTLSTEGKNILEINVVFGGFEMIIPRDWNIIVNATSVFGGFNVKNGISVSQIDYTKELIIKGNVVFGGGEIKRV